MSTVALPSAGSPATCHNRRSIPCASKCPTADSIADSTHNCAGSLVVYPTSASSSFLNSMNLNTPALRPTE